MEITLDKKSNNEGLVKIKLTEADYQPRVEAKIKDYGKKVNIKGFRPGKAPASMIKKMYGTSVLVEEINDILSKTLNDYIKTNDIQILGEPLPDMEASKRIDWDNQKEFEFAYQIGFVGDLKIELNDKIKATAYEIELDDKAVEDTIANLRSQYGDTSNPEVSEEGDFIFGELVSEDGSTKKTTSLPLEKMDGRVQKKFIGVKKDDTIEFEPAKAFKKGESAEDILNLTAEESQAFATGKATFTVKNINRTSEAELNQDFFDKIFGKDAVDSLEGFKAKVKDVLTSNYNKEAASFSNEKIKEAIVSKMKIDLPDEFLKKWLVAANENKFSAEQVAAEYDQYATQLRWSIIANEIAKNNSIKVEHEDVVEATKNMIREQLAASGLGAQLEANMDAFVDNYLKGENGDNYMKTLNQVQSEKVLAVAKEQITVKTEKVSPDKLREIAAN
ncbi:trigger factor [Penaeicola halotolerans]|uniref:trigger factor n=1 Tax=Penaeicola halotolerans TaxID=2793196 RepID=UPI001CF91464|nr:trigger factor [Penaeicola halotolerans]